MNKKYKKVLVLLLALGMIVSHTACGTVQKSLSEQQSVENAQVNTAESDSGNETEVNEVYLDFSVFNNVEITGIDLSDLSAEELIGIEKPVVNINGSYASVSYTSVLNANAYGAKGTYRIDGTHWYEKQDENWIACNAPEQ